MKKNILLTFDYELFLGKKSGTVENCLLKPTNQLLEILEKRKAKAIFFIDTTYLQRLISISKTNKEAKNDFEKITKQLVRMAREGHYLYHHLHPHWLDAIYLEKLNQWSLEKTDKFVFHSLREQEKDDLFKFSNIFLSSIYKDAEKEIPSDGYRAGGLYIEPFRSIAPFFEKYGINYEFSVVSGEKKEGDLYYYDFTNSPRNRIYNFEKKIAEEELNGIYVEYPISMLRIKGLTKIINGIYYRFMLSNIKNKPFGDGLSVGNEINKKPKKTLKKYYSFNIAMSVELLNPFLLPLYKKMIKQNSFIHFLSHPKLISTCSLVSLDKMLQFCMRKYDVEFDFKKMVQ